MANSVDLVCRIFSGQHRLLLEASLVRLCATAFGQEHVRPGIRNRGSAQRLVGSLTSIGRSILKPIVF